MHSTFRMTTPADVELLEATPLAARKLPESTYALLQNVAKKFPEKVAMRYLTTCMKKENAVTYTFTELLNRVTQTANALHTLGVLKTDVVSSLLPNIPQAHFTIWGAEATGIFNPINPMLEQDHLAGILNEAQTKVLVTLAPTIDGDLWHKVRDLFDLVPSLKTILTVNIRLENGNNETVSTSQTALDSRVIDFDDYVDQQPYDALLSSRVINANEVASYFHTGGTTGTPKLAPHTHKNEIVSCWQLATVTQLTDEDVSLCGLPLFHVNAVFLTGLAGWMVGAEVIIATPQGYRNPLTIKQFWMLVEKYQVSYFSAVPTILSRLMEIPTAGYDLSSLQYCICGAAPLATELMRKFEKTTGLVVLEGYGQTEGTCASTANPRFGERRVGSVGGRLPYMQLRTVIVNPEGKALRDCEVNEAGVIAIKGPNIFKGYLRDDQNKGIWVDEDWFNTGDLGRIDEEGYLWLTGRSKDLIIRGGHNIDPQVIEEALYTHPMVVEVAAVGKPDANVGELPVAYVELMPDANVSTDELLKYAAGAISERAAIPKEILIVDALPHTAVGKIFKPDLIKDQIRSVVLKQLADLMEQKLISKVDVVDSKQFGQIVHITVSEFEPLHQPIHQLLSPFAFQYELLEMEDE